MSQFKVWTVRLRLNLCQMSCKPILKKLTNRQDLHWNPGILQIVRVSKLWLEQILTFQICKMTYMPVFREMLHQVGYNRCLSGQPEGLQVHSQGLINTTLLKVKGSAEHQEN